MLSARKQYGVPCLEWSCRNERLLTHRDSGDTRWWDLPGLGALEPWPVGYLPPAVPTGGE